MKTFDFRWENVESSPKMVEATEGKWVLRDEAEAEMRRPLIGVAILIVRDWKVLMSERLAGGGVGTYGLPGGHLEFGESFADACQREMMEETGMPCGNVKFITAVNKGIVSTGRHYVTLFFSASVPDDAQPQDKEPDKHGPWKWFRVDELPKIMFEDIRKIVSIFLQQEALEMGPNLSAR